MLLLTAWLGGCQGEPAADSPTKAAASADVDEPSVRDRTPASTETSNDTPVAERRVPVVEPEFVDNMPDWSEVTAPLDEAGFPDYLAAYEAACSKGVTPQTNVMAGLRAILGTAGLPADSVDSYFARLGIDPRNEREQQFVPLEGKPQTLVIRGNREPTQEELQRLRGTPAQQQLQSARTEPWRAADAPAVFDWITENRKLVPAIKKACRRPRCYMPAVSGSSLADAEFDRFAVEQVCSFLCAYAMLQLDEGNIEATIDALAAATRLSRHAINLPDSTAALEGCAASAVVDSAVLALLVDPRCRVEHVRTLDAALDAIGSPSLDVDRFVTWSRWSCADSILQLARKLPDNGKGGPIDFERAVAAGDRYFERLSENPTLAHTERVQAEINAIRQEVIRELRTAVQDPSELQERAQRGEPPILLMAEHIDSAERLLVAELLPPHISTPVTTGAALRRRVCSYRLLRLGTRALLQRASRSSVLPSIDEVEPAEVAVDPYSGNRFRMRADPNTIVIYSVGENGIDDGGRGEFFYGADFVIRLRPVRN